MIKAIIFDMDGLLIDSEPIWHRVESNVYQSIGLPITEKNVQETMGMRLEEAISYWHHKYAWKTPSQKEIGERIVHAVIEELNKNGKPQPGVYEIIKQFEKKQLPMSIASSSEMSIIKAVVKKLDIGQYLTAIHSAEHEPYGKPHPAVYLSTAKTLKVRPQDCLVFEDSPVGVLAAKAAQMTCIAVPNAHVKGDKRFAIADKIINSLEDFSKTSILD